LLSWGAQQYRLVPPLVLLDLPRDLQQSMVSHLIVDCSRLRPMLLLMAL